MKQLIASTLKPAQFIGLSFFISASCLSINANANDASSKKTHLTAQLVDIKSIDTATAPSSLSNTFKPNPKVSTRLDFTIWSDWLKANVLYAGPSIRKLAPSAVSPASRQTGSRFIVGHKSRYRFEGNKIPYRTMQEAHENFLPVYQKDLEALSDTLDITSLSRNDQLAYWFNLHNVALINIIADHSPVRRPGKIKPIKGDNSQLHDAKVVTVNGHNMSLRDIREKIVYANWSDSIVIYGFHHGILGGPNINYHAYDRHNIGELLRENAEEFTNSFRGYREGKISPIYKDASQFYFPEGKTDIRDHLKRFMRDEIYTELSSYKRLKWQKPISDVASLSSGRVNGLGRIVTSRDPRSGQELAVFVPIYVTEALQARDNSIRTAKKRGWLPDNKVTIEDVETNDSRQASPEIK
ncbi:MAG: DUF547 domain-containing protein [Litorimonas sp.]